MNPQFSYDDLLNKLKAHEKTLAELTCLYQTRRAPIKELRAEIKHLRAKLREANRGAERNVYKVQNLLNELSVMTVECIDGDHYKRRIKELFENYDFKS